MIKYYNYFIAVATLRFSRPVRTSSTAVNCPVRLILSRTFSGCRKTSKPHTLALPLSALRIVDSILTIVVFPAPFEPSNAKISPCYTSKSTPFRTSVFYRIFSIPLWLWQNQSFGIIPFSEFFHYVVVKLLAPVFRIRFGVEQKFIAERRHVLARDFQNLSAFHRAGFE